MLEKKIMFATFLALGSCGVAQGQNFDSLYADNLVALTHQCSESYPDLKPKIDDAFRRYVVINANSLSKDYETKIRKHLPSTQTYTREQCMGMAILPEKPMDDLILQYAKELKESERRRSEFEKSNK